MPCTKTNTTPIRAILLAAGSSSRLVAAGLSTRKQFLNLKERPLFWHAARTLAELPRMHELIFVFPADELEAANNLTTKLDNIEPIGLPWQAVAGGKRRQDSVAAGLAILHTNAGAHDFVLVHDAARPFASVSLAARIIAGLDAGARAVIPAIPVKDTIKRLIGNYVGETMLQENLYAVQTPQGFLMADLQTAYAAATNWTATDDASLVERIGLPVRIVPGENTNQKITTIDDLRLLAPVIPSPRLLPCTSMGYDVHRYGLGRPLKLGGVPIPGGPEIIAHSDGDVLLHALADALLGLIGGGDIGGRFPESNPTLENIESATLVNEILHDVRKVGIELAHVDCTLVAQIPKIAPWSLHIKANLSQLLMLPLASVNVKATTEEKLGFTGEKKGIKAYVLVTALRPSTQGQT
ncbi:2-C-methyl-D-erythritol 4-phosphate cytidylyltransferase / 2-C-methyl-D-erythritol 2,4-cyclodiphosphate synthase [Desulfovibrionales bacterium]